MFLLIITEKIQIVNFSIFKQKVTIHLVPVFR